MGLKKGNDMTKFYLKVTICHIILVPPFRRLAFKVFEVA
jgi:hypothetical protein